MLADQSAISIANPETGQRCRKSQCSSPRQQAVSNFWHYIDTQSGQRLNGVSGRAFRAAGTRQLSPAGLPQTVFGQLLGHQEAVQVTRARAACPLRLGWKKSRALTWLALNWTL
jgi:hypothetical protein